MAKTFSGYKLEGRTKFQGLNISIENERGTFRRGTDSDGNEWATFMHIPYGYIRASEGVDGDHVDCYIGGNPHSDQVFIVHQQDPKTKAYDEDKVMLGYNIASDAKTAYIRQYDRPGYFQSMDQLNMHTFKTMLKTRYGVKLKKSAADTMKKEGKYIEGKTKIKVKPSELAAGIKVEMEHTKDRAVAKQIALDHLAEDPEYYSKLAAHHVEKSKRMPIGTISHGRKKIAEGKWVPVKKVATTTHKQAFVDRMMDIVSDEYGAGESDIHDWMKEVGIKSVDFTKWSNDDLETAFSYDRHPKEFEPTAEEKANVEKLMRQRPLSGSKKIGVAVWTDASLNALRDWVFVVEGDDYHNTCAAIRQAIMRDDFRGKKFKGVSIIKAIEGYSVMKPSFEHGRALVNQANPMKIDAALWRGSTNPQWQNAEVGDSIPVGMASFTSKKTTAEGFSGTESNSVLLRVPKKYTGSVEGIDIRQVADALGDDTAMHYRITLGSEVREVVIRAPTLRVVSKKVNAKGITVIDVAPASASGKDLITKSVIGYNVESFLIEIFKDLSQPIGKPPLKKAKKMAIGTVSRGRKKVAEGKWVPVSSEKTGHIKGDLNMTFYSRYKDQWTPKAKYEDFVRANQSIIESEVDRLRQTSKQITDLKLLGEHYKSGMRDLKNQITTIWDSLKKLPAQTMQKARGRQYLTPIKRQVTRKGKTFMMTVWVGKEEAQQIKAARNLMPAVTERPRKGTARGETTFLMKNQTAIKYAPGSRRQIDRSMELQAQMFPEGSMTGAETEDILEAADTEIQLIMEQERKGVDSGRDWYTTSMEKARTTLAKIHPELVDDTEWNKLAALIAITSPGMKIVENMGAALGLYEQLKETGKIPPTKPDGTKWPGKSTEVTITIINTYVDALGGPDEFFQWLRDSSTGRELNKFKRGKPLMMDKEYPNSIVFGPKVGVFYRNMLGEHEHLTIDRWALRSFYRWSNKIQPFYNSLGQWEAKVQDPTSGELAEMTYVLGALATEYDLTMSEVQAMFWYYEKRLYSRLAGTRTIDKKELSYNDAADTAYESFITRGS